MKRIIVLFCFHLAVMLPLFSQIEYSEIQSIHALRKNPAIPYVTVGGDSINETKIKELQSVQSKQYGYKVDIFGIKINVDYSPDNSGTWDSLPNGYSSWKLGITARNARSLSLILDPFELSKGCKVFVYSPDLKSVLGAYTFRNNKKTKILPLSPINNDSIIVELQVADYVKNYGHFEIAGIGVEPSANTMEKSATDEWYGTSAPCEVDVNCDTDRGVQVQKHAVQRVIFYSHKYIIRCSGTLLNNTKEDGLPLYLTAGHCIQDDYNASTAVFYFDYESPYCGGPDGPIKSIAGSKILSHSGPDSLDFTLVEMSEKPPFYYNPLYSGWDATGGASFDTTYIIHHPEGDVKKITINYDPVTEGSYYGSIPNEDWVIENYEVGTTEDGSSGAPLFNSKFRDVGSLTGGQNPCSYYMEDFYSKFSDAWDYDADSIQQLKHWLDPAGTGQLVLDNYNPYQNLNKVTQTLTNITNNKNFTTEKMAGGWGYISGHNYLYEEKYAEKFEVNGSKYIDAVSLGVSKSVGLSDSSKIKLTIWEGNDPSNVIYEQNVYLFELSAGSETSIRLDSQMFASNTFYVGYQVFYQAPQDTFAVYTAPPVTDMSKNTAYVLQNNSWTPLTDGIQNYYTSLDIKLSVLDYYVKKGADPGKFPFGDMTLYPNPVSDKLQLLFKDLNNQDVNIKIYNVSGELVYSKTMVKPQPNFGIDVSRLNRGFYILKAWTDKNNYTGKFLKL